MNKSRSTRHKLFILVSLAVFLCVISVVSIVLVLAAQVQNVDTDIRVVYNSNGVNARVSANYIVGNETKPMVLTDGVTTEIVFSGNQSQSQKVLKPQEDTISLSFDNQSIIFEYMFENLSDTHCFTIDLTTQPEQTNMKIRYFFSTTKITDFSKLTYSSYIKQTMMNGAGNKIYVYILAEIYNTSIDSSYEGQYVWNLQNERNVQTVNLDNSFYDVVVDADESMKVIYTEAMPTLTTIPTIEYAGVTFVFDGYYSLKGGRGTKYIDANGCSVRTCNLLPGDTLYINFRKAYAGQYPQTYVGEDLNGYLKDRFSLGLLQATEKSYTVDINDAEFTLQEFEYEGEYYARLEFANVYDNNLYYFSSGELIRTGYSYFFKVEPIEFDVFVYNGAVTLVSEQILGSRKMRASIWRDSSLRTYLQGDFATESGLGEIAQTISHYNSDCVLSDSTDLTGDFEVEDTLYVMSYNEALKFYPSGGAKTHTDLSLATYSNRNLTNGNGMHNLRSILDSSHIYKILSGHIFDCSSDVARHGYAVAFTVSSLESVEIKQEATCTQEGLIEYKYTSGVQIYTEVIPKTNHAFGSSGTGTGNTTATCQVCGEIFEFAHEVRTTTIGANYGFSYNASTGYYSATNYGLDGTEASATINIYTGAFDIIIDYEVISEAGYDYLNIIKNGESLNVPNGYDDMFQYSGDVVGSYRLSVAQGDVIEIVYHKDGSVHAYNEMAKFKLTISPSQK